MLSVFTDLDGSVCCYKKKGDNAIQKHFQTSHDKVTCMLKGFNSLCSVFSMYMQLQIRKRRVSFIFFRDNLNLFPL